MSRAPSSPPVDVIVIGAGPAGLTAAGKAAGCGRSVVLLEGEEEGGKKLLLTGRKRCNLTAALPLAEFVEGYGPNGRFLLNVFSRFFRDDLVDFLDGLGVETAGERGGRIYPARGGAKAVLDALLRFIRDRGVDLRTGRRVTGLERGEDGLFTVRGEDFALRARKVIVAAGGSSFPWTGSRGDGFGLARTLGHRVAKLRPALVPVRCGETFSGRLAGLRLRNVSLSFKGGRKRRESFFGEVHFTDFGITGPAVFHASRQIGILTEKAPLPLEIDLKPALTEKVLEARIDRELSAAGEGVLSEVMERLLPAVLAPVLLELAGLSPDLPSSRTGRKARKGIVRLLKGFPLTAVGALPLERAMVTAGGVDLREIDPATMESRLVPGLYFAGEVLDLDGTTGGYNLQAAFSTGWLAGLNAAGGEG